MPGTGPLSNIFRRLSKADTVPRASTVDASNPRLFENATDFDPRTYTGPRGPYDKMSAAEQRAVDAELEAIEARRTPEDIAAAKALSGPKSVFETGPAQSLRELAADYRAQQPGVKGAIGSALMTVSMVRAQVENGVRKAIVREARPGVRNPQLNPESASSNPAYPSGHSAAQAAVTEAAKRLRVERAVDLDQRALNMAKARMVLGAHSANEVVAGLEVGAKAPNSVAPKRVWDWLAVPEKPEV